MTSNKSDPLYEYWESFNNKKCSPYDHLVNKTVTDFFTNI